MDLKKKKNHWSKSYLYNKKQNVKLNINNIQDCFSTRNPSGITSGFITFYYIYK